MSRVPTNGIDYTSKDYESFRNDMIKQLRIKMPEYTDIRQSDAGIVLLELLAQGLDVLSYYQDVIANEAFFITAEQRNSVLKWCQMLNYIPKASTPSEFTQVFVLSSAQDTDTIIPSGTKVKTKGSSTEPEIYFETASDLVIPAGKLGNEMKNGKYLYSVKVVQGISVSGELLGTSTGTKDQSFKLSYTPVILDSISIIINEGGGFEKWKRVDNFFDSTSTSKDFVVFINDNDEATVTFGDGVFGKIPFVYKNGIYCNYRVGGGTQGNVGAMKICLLDSNLALVEETFNPYMADVMGFDKESIEEIKRNAPASHKNIWGAVTVNDFAEVVKSNFSEVSKAWSCQTGEDGTDIDIYVLPKAGVDLTDSLKNSVLDLFDENKGGRKIIGAGEVFVKPAVFTPIDFSATLIVKSGYDFHKVSKKVTEYFEYYFSLENQEFNTNLSIPNLNAEIMNPNNLIDGVLVFKVISPTWDILTPQRPGTIFTLGSLHIVEEVL